MELFALLGTILSVVFGAITNAANKENANEQLQNQQQFSHNEAILANQRAVENYWETMSPQSKVQQYKDAGLSVGLMYGGNGVGGGVNTGTQAQTPAANLPVMQNPMAGAMTELFQNLKSIEEKENISEDTEKKKSEIEKNKSEIEVNSATIEKIATENNLTEVLTQNAKLDGTLKQIETEVQQATKETRIEIAAIQLENLKKEGEKLLEEIKGAKIENEYKEKMYLATINKIKAETALTWKTIVKVEAETTLIEAQKGLTEMQEHKTFSEAQKIWKEVENYEKQIAKIDAEIKLMEAEKEATEAGTFNTKMGRVGQVISWISELRKGNSEILNSMMMLAK